MNIQDAEISMEVVRSIGGENTGRTGLIMTLDIKGNRVQVDWEFGTCTWVSVTSVEPTSIAYEIIPGKWDDKNGRRISLPKYIRKG